MENNRPLNDQDREEILRLVLTEASGGDVSGQLGRFPVSVRNTFRRVVEEAGLVRSGGTLLSDHGEAVFQQPLSLTERGRRRLMELNQRRDAR
jgi:hypothetical protein